MQLLRDNRNNLSGTQEEVDESDVGTAYIKSKDESKCAFCLKCSAWRGQLGLEPTFQLYLTHLLSIFDEIHRVLKKTGTCWVNLGDTYATHTGKRTGQFDSSVESEINSIFTENRPMQSVSEKSLCCIPDRFKIMMVDKGWILRNTIIWYKRSCMPSSAKDRFTVDFEYVFFFTKSGKYWFEQQLEKTITKDDSIRDRDNTKLNNTPGRRVMQGLKLNNYELKNMRCVWDICPKPNKEEHYAAYPTELVDRMIKAGCPPDGIVLDPFGGIATTGVSAKQLGRQFICIELSEKYVGMAEKRINKTFRQEVLI